MLICFVAGALLLYATSLLSLSLPELLLSVYLCPILSAGLLRAAVCFPFFGHKIEGRTRTLYLSVCAFCLFFPDAIAAFVLQMPYLLLEAQTVAICLLSVASLGRLAHRRNLRLAVGGAFGLCIGGAGVSYSLIFGNFLPLIMGVCYAGLLLVLTTKTASAKASDAEPAPPCGASTQKKFAACMNEFRECKNAGTLAELFVKSRSRLNVAVSDEEKGLYSFVHYTVLFPLVLLSANERDGAGEVMLRDHIYTALDFVLYCRKTVVRRYLTLHATRMATQYKEAYAEVFVAFCMVHFFMTREEATRYYTHRVEVFDKEISRYEDGDPTFERLRRLYLHDLMGDIFPEDIYTGTSVAAAAQVAFLTEESLRLRRLVEQTFAEKMKGSV